LFTFFILICRFSYVNAFHAHVTAGAKALSGNVVVSYLVTRLLSWDLSCHLLVQEEPFYF